MGRIFWRELYRECSCRLDVLFKTKPVPSLRIRWLPKAGVFPSGFVAFSGDPKTCSIDPSVFVEGSAPVLVGDGVTIEEGAVLATSQHLLERSRFMCGAVEGRPIIIEEGVTVGRGAIICGGALLGKACRIEPGSVVSGSIDAGVTAGGIPAKPHMVHRLKTSGALPARINKVAAKCFFHTNILLIQKFFGPQIAIGENTFSNRELAICGCGQLRIGRRVMFAPRVEIDLTDDSTESIIEDDVWIGAGVRLTAPFHVRRQSILAAGCYFNGMNGRSGVWGGRPAQLIHHDTATAHLIPH